MFVKSENIFPYQCSRNVCKNADNPSITTRIATVNTAQNINIAASTTPFHGIAIRAPIMSALRITIFHSTSESSVYN